MPTFSPPPRNAAAYGDRGDVARAQLCSCVDPEQSCTHALSIPLFSSCSSHGDIHKVAHARSQSETRNLQEIYTGTYAICAVFPAWFPSSLLFALRLTPTLSALFPG